MITTEENALSHLSSIAVQHLTCDFPGVRALNDLSLQFKAGEIHALVEKTEPGSPRCSKFSPASSYLPRAKS